MKVRAHALFFILKEGYHIFKVLCLPKEQNVKSEWFGVTMLCSKIMRSIFLMSFENVCIWLQFKKPTAAGTLQSLLFYCHFHNSYSVLFQFSFSISKVIRGELFSDIEVLLIEKFMRMAVKAAQNSDSEEVPSCSQYLPI